MMENRVDQGRSIYIACLPDEAFYGEYLGDLLRDCGVERTLEAELPREIESACRSADDGRRIVFLMNRAAEDVTVVLPGPMQDVWHEESVDGETVIPGNGVRILTHASGIGPQNRI